MGADPRDAGEGAGNRLTAWPGVGLGRGLGRGSVGETPRRKKGGEGGRMAGQLDGRMGRAKGTAPKGKIGQLVCGPSLQGETLVAFHRGGLSFHICGFLVPRRLYRQSSRGGSSPQETPVRDCGRRDQRAGRGLVAKAPEKTAREGGSALERKPWWGRGPHFWGGGLRGPRAPGHCSTGRVKHPPTSHPLWAPPSCLRPPQNIQPPAGLHSGPVPPHLQ